MQTKRIIFENLHDIDLTHIFECGQCFRWVPAEDGSGDYIGAAGGFAARAGLSPAAGASDDHGAVLTLDVTGGSEEFWRDYFDLDTDYGEIMRTLAASEPCMREALEYGSGIRILNQDLFETLISFIVSQNNNIPRIRKCIEAICSRYGDHIGEAWGRDWYTFPDAETLAAAAVDDLMGLRLGYRSSYIKASAERYAGGMIPETREDTLAFCGVGPKVANCIMLFGLRDTAAFPVDTWVRYIMHDMYAFDEKDGAGMERFAREKFGDLAGYAQQYLFYYYREKGK